MGVEYPCGCYASSSSSKWNGYYASGASCDGGHTCGKTITSTQSVKCACTRTVVAPVITGYTDATATYTVNTAIADNKPTHQAAWWESATDPTTYAITPSIPGGLSFDTATGWITGTPLDAIVTTAGGCKCKATWNYRGFPYAGTCSTIGDPKP